MIKHREYKLLLTKIESYQSTLVAVSKKQKVKKIEQAYDWGQRDFGENLIQELVEKQSQLPKDIKWHMIGHLQSNKVKYIAPFIHLIHSVDSLKLTNKINAEGIKHNKTINILLQVKIAEEVTKFGLSLDELHKILSHYSKDEFSGIKIQGLMGMASNSLNTEKIKKEFQNLNSIFSHAKDEFQLDKNIFYTKSFGMSSDYQVALENGSTMLRIGSSIFGARDY